VTVNTKYSAGCTEIQYWRGCEIVCGEREEGKYINKNERHTEKGH
jgi:hypothetical protein